MSVKTFNPDLWLSDVPFSSAQSETLNEWRCGAKYFCFIVPDVDAAQKDEHLRKGFMRRLTYELSKFLPSPDACCRICDMEAYTSTSGGDRIRGRFLYSTTPTAGST